MREQGSRLNGKELELFLEKTKVLFPAPIPGASRLPVNPVPGDLTCWFWGYCTQKHSHPPPSTYTYVKNQKIKKQLTDCEDNLSFPFPMFSGFRVRAWLPESKKGQGWILWQQFLLLMLIWNVTGATLLASSSADALTPYSPWLWLSRNSPQEFWNIQNSMLGGWCMLRIRPQETEGMHIVQESFRAI